MNGSLYPAGGKVSVEGIAQENGLFAVDVVEEDGAGLEPSAPLKAGGHKLKTILETYQSTVSVW